MPLDTEAAVENAASPSKAKQKLDALKQRREQQQQQRQQRAEGKGDGKGGGEGQSLLGAQDKAVLDKGAINTAYVLFASAAASLLLVGYATYDILGK